jgi:hypothetical protein
MHSNGGETVTWASRVRAFLMRHPRILGTMLNAWGVLIGSLAVFACAVFFIDPESTLDRSSLSFQLGGWANVWNVLYGVGGLLMVYGIVRPDRAADVAGLFLFGRRDAHQFHVDRAHARAAVADRRTAPHRVLPRGDRPRGRHHRDRGDALRA